MNVTRLIRAGVAYRPLPHLLHLLLLAVATGLIVLTLLVGQQLQQRVARDAAAVDMVIGARGSALQLVLASVYHLDAPTGNIPLTALDDWAAHPLVATAVPVSLGDSAHGFRIVGATADLLALYGADLSEGRVWDRPMEAVVGAEVADHGLSVGRQLIGAHGLNGGQAHDEAPYRIVGRLAPTGTVIDRLILTSLTSVWALHGDDPEHDDAAHEHEHEHERDHAGREITALLIRYRSPLAAAMLPREVMQSPGLMAATPAQEWLRLRVLAEPGLRALLGLATALAVLAALAMLAALNSALEARRYDLAVLRALGATRWQVVRLLWLEAALLALAGALLGSVLARLAAALISLALPAQPFTAMAWVAGEGWVYLLALGLASLAVWLPAWRAYRTDVAGVLSRP
jgi:putative ABC transport system permease protein